MAERAPLVPRDKPPLNGLTEASVRQGFVQKVFGIFSIQLVTTVVVGGLVMTYFEPAARKNPTAVQLLLSASMIIIFGVCCMSCCCPQIMRSYPGNYIILGLFTVGEAVLAGVVCLQYTQESVLIALFITALVSVSLFVFACQTKYDFSGFGPYVLSGLMILIGLSLVLSFASIFSASGQAFEFARLLIAAVGALFFSVFIVYDVQLIIGGKHEHQFSIDDYCFAAMSLYLDILNLFLYILELCGGERN